MLASAGIPMGNLASLKDCTTVLIHSNEQIQRSDRQYHCYSICYQEISSKGNKHNTQYMNTHNILRNASE